jgi:hypothetical protein
LKTTTDPASRRHGIAQPADAAVRQVWHHDVGRREGLLIIGMIALIEAFGTAVVVWPYSHAASLALIGVVLSAMGWAVWEQYAIGNSFVTLDRTAVRLRYGLAVSAFVPLDAIQSTTINISFYPDTTSARFYSPLAQPNVALQLRYPIEVTALFPRVRVVSHIYLRLQDAESFHAVILATRSSTDSAG